MEQSMNFFFFFFFFSVLASGLVQRAGLGNEKKKKKNAAAKEPRRKKNGKEIRYFCRIIKNLSFWDFSSIVFLFIFLHGVLFLIIFC